MPFTFLISAPAVQVYTVVNHVTLARVPVTMMQITGEALCATGSISVAADGVRLLQSPTSFGVQDAHRLALPLKLPDVRNVPVGTVAAGAMLITAVKFRLELHVLFERNFSSIEYIGQRGPGGRPMARARFRARAFAAIGLNYIVEYQQVVLDYARRWQPADIVPGITGTETETGRAGETVFLHDVVCEPVEPPDGVKYNTFEPAGAGMAVIALT